MKLMITGILGIIMGIGGYALLQATMKEREAHAAQAAQREHCRQVNALMLSEFDAIVRDGKFPTQDQQDQWKKMMMGCE